jgi:hypothetical protein
MHKLACVVAKSMIRPVNAHSTLTKQYYSRSEIFLRTLPSGKLGQPKCLVRLTVVLSRILRCKIMLSPYRNPFPSRMVCICISYTHCSQMRTGLSCSKCKLLILTHAYLQLPQSSAHILAAYYDTIKQRLTSKS